MTEPAPSLVDLARRYGVATEYLDWTGRHATVAESTLVAVLDALGVTAATEDERAAALVSHERDHWARSLPPTIVARAGTASTFWVHVTHGDPVGLWLRLEDGSVRTGLRQVENNRAPYDLDGRLVGEASFELPADLPLGYHQLHVQVGSADISTLVIVSPASLELPARLGSSRAWGLATQLYSVCSERSWGTGDLTDLTDLAIWSASQHGAGFILVNPLHAASPTTPMEPSPYLPTSRRYVNPLYLRVEAIPEFAYVRGRGRLRKARENLQARANASELIDRDRAWKVKRAALKDVYRVTRSAGRDLAYAAYSAREGRSLDDFATWCALAEEHGADWHHWPEELQHPENTAVADFAAEHADAVDFHRWLQWQLDDQLTAAQASAVQAGMKLGVMHDLAVGVDPNGADAWALQDVLALGVSRRSSARRVQPARTGLVAAAVAARHAGRTLLRAVPCARQRGASACGRCPHRPHHRVVPAVVDSERGITDRGHLRAVRPRGDDRHRRAGSTPGGCRRRRRGPGHRRTVGAGLSGRPRPVRHVDPVVRAGPRRRRRPAARRAMA